MFGKDLQTYAKGLANALGTKAFSSQGSGDKRHPHAIVLLEENSDGMQSIPFNITCFSYQLIFNSS